MTRWLWPVLILVAFCGRRSVAYEEYAARYNINSCTACHISPVGGGPRNTYGKLFGAHNFPMNPFLVQDYVSADLRALYYYPQRPGPSKDGAGVMSGSVAGHASLDAEQRIQLVIEANLAGFSAAPVRDTYALFRLSGDSKSNWFDTLLVGRFRSPFGVVTDEHRTYVRIQSGTTWNDFETGVLLSGNPSYRCHYDLALVNGEDSTGQTLQNGEALRDGAIGNIRWLAGPALVGLSGSYHDHDQSRDSSKAASLYSILSVGRWTDDKVPLNLHLEYDRAWGWDHALGQGFAGNSTYVASLGDSGSYGGLFLAEYELTPHFFLIYKYDLLVPDGTYPSDYYERHGVGFRWIIGPNAIVQARTEFAKATNPTEAGSTAVGGQNATFAVLQLAL